MSLRLNKETQQSIVNYINAKIKAKIPELNLDAKDNFVKILNEAVASNLYSLFRFADAKLTQISTVDGNLEYLGEAYGLPRLQPQKATGLVILSGTRGTLVEAGNVFFDGLLETQDNTTIEEYLLNNINISINNNVATYVGINILPSGLTVNITYQGLTKPVNLMEANANGFKFSTLPFNGGVANGSGVATLKVDVAICDVASVEAGLSNNIAGNTTFSTQNLIEGIDATGYVSASGITGGSDLETMERWQKRIEVAVKGYVSSGSNDNLVLSILTATPEATRVYIQNPETEAEAGKVTVYVLYDNRVNILPNSLDIENIKDALTLPGGFNKENDLILTGLQLIPINITYTDLQPNTELMQNAVSNAIKEFFNDEEQTAPGRDFVADNLRLYLLANCKDINGVVLKNINLTASDTSVAKNQLCRWANAV